MIWPSANAWLAGWVSAYADHASLRTAVVFCHVGALLVGGGAAVTADRATLRAFRRAPEERARHLQAIGAIHRLVVAALAVIAVSGLLQFFSDTSTFLHSRVFWTKMGLVAALLLNGGALVHAEGCALATGAETAWRRLRLVSIFSLCLWLAITLAGAGLVSM